MLAQSHYFVAAVRDIENRDAVNPVPAPEIVHDSCLGGCVQSRERFVEQKQAGISHESSGQRYALTFSTGDFRWQLPAQVVDAELVQHGCDSLFPGGSRQMREPIFGILLSRQMWKQSEILQYVSDFSLGD
jgi:hypothetical protein